VVLAIGTDHLAAMGAPPGRFPHAAAASPTVSDIEISDIEIKVLRRRLEQLQTELKVYRTNKFNEETARRMEDLENDISMIEIERAKFAAATDETSASLSDLLSSLRIEVMAAEGEFEQYAANIPRASYELIRRALKDGQQH